MRAINRKFWLAIISTVWLASAGQASAANDYPTTALADYVFACMKANGDTRQALERCSCSFDVVASIVPYEDYVSAETFRRMSLLSGEASGLFRESAPAKAATGGLRRAQAEAEIRCF